MIFQRSFEEEAFGKKIINGRESCPNCNRDYKAFFIGDFPHNVEAYGKNEPIPENKVRFLNEYLKKQVDSYCFACEAETTINFKKEEDQLKNKILKLINIIPTATIPVPPKWDYKVLDVVIAFSTSLKSNEALNELRRKTIEMKGNAIVDIKINLVIEDEFIVSGTAVKIVNTEIFGEDQNKKFEELEKLTDKYKYLFEFREKYAYL